MPHDIRIFPLRYAFSSFIYTSSLLSSCVSNNRIDKIEFIRHRYNVPHQAPLFAFRSFYPKTDHLKFSTIEIFFWQSNNSMFSDPVLTPRDGRFQSKAKAEKVHHIHGMQHHNSPSQPQKGILFDQVAIAETLSRTTYILAKIARIPDLLHSSPPPPPPCPIPPSKPFSCFTTCFLPWGSAAPTHIPSFITHGLLQDILARTQHKDIQPRSLHRSAEFHSRSHSPQALTPTILQNCLGAWSWTSNHTYFHSFLKKAFLKLDLEARIQFNSTRCC